MTLFTVLYCTFMKTPRGCRPWSATARRRRRPRQSLSHSLARRRRRRACSSRSASSWAISARNRIDRVVAPGPQGCCCCPWSATARRRACSSRLLAAVSPCGARSGVDEEVKAGCDIVGLFFLLLFSRPLPNYGSQYVRVPGTVYFNVILVRRLCCDDDLRKIRAESPPHVKEKLG